MTDITPNEKQFDFKGKKILVVEDIESNFKLLIAILKHTGAEVILAESGNDALRIFSENPEINLVLMDIQLPDINGRDVTRKLKQIREDIPIIAQTAFAMAGDREKCLEAGCNDYVPKPIARVALLELIAKNLYQDNLNKL